MATHDYYVKRSNTAGEAIRAIPYRGTQKDASDLINFLNTTRNKVSQQALQGQNLMIGFAEGTLLTVTPGQTVLVHSYFDIVGLRSSEVFKEQYIRKSEAKEKGLPVSAQGSRLVEGGVSAPAAKAPAARPTLGKKPAESSAEKSDKWLSPTGISSDLSLGFVWGSFPVLKNALEPHGFQLNFIESYGSGEDEMPSRVQITSDDEEFAEDIIHGSALLVDKGRILELSQVIHSGDPGVNGVAPTYAGAAVIAPQGSDLKSYIQALKSNPNSTGLSLSSDKKTMKLKYGSKSVDIPLGDTVVWDGVNFFSVGKKAAVATGRRR